MLLPRLSVLQAENPGLESQLTRLAVSVIMGRTKFSELLFSLLQNGSKNNS